MTATGWMQRVFGAKGQEGLRPEDAARADAELLAELERLRGAEKEANEQLAQLREQAGAGESALQVANATITTLQRDLAAARAKAEEQENNFEAERRRAESLVKAATAANRRAEKRLADAQGLEKRAAELEARASALGEQLARQQAEAGEAQQRARAAEEELARAKRDGAERERQLEAARRESAQQREALDAAAAAAKRRRGTLLDLVRVSARALEVVSGSRLHLALELAHRQRPIVSLPAEATLAAAAHSVAELLASLAIAEGFSAEPAGDDSAGDGPGAGEGRGGELRCRFALSSELAGEASTLGPWVAAYATAALGSALGRALSVSAIEGGPHDFTCLLGER